MKKIFALILATLMLASACLGLTACGGDDPADTTSAPKNSGITIASFTTIMKETDEDLLLTLNGDRYTYAESNSFCYSVGTDANGYVTDVTIENYNIDATKSATAQGILTIATKTYSEWTMADYRIVSCLLRLTYLIDISGIDDSTIKALDTADIIASGTNRVYGDWTFSAERNGTTVILRAKYNK